MMKAADFQNPDAPKGKQVGKDWPSWRYGPDGEAQVFQRAEDVPHGWKDHPARLFEPPPKVAPPPMERNAVKAELRMRGVKFKPNASTSDLYKMLLEAGYEHGAGVGDSGDP